MFSLICDCIDVWVNNRKAGDMRRHRIYYDVIVMLVIISYKQCHSYQISTDLPSPPRTQSKPYHPLVPVRSYSPCRVPAADSADLPPPEGHLVPIVPSWGYCRQARSNHHQLAIWYLQAKVAYRNCNVIKIISGNPCIQNYLYSCEDINRATEMMNKRKLISNIFHWWFESRKFI